ncbi:MAG: hypothetical protein VYA11_01430 [Planctomycetota bacterium]|nr:hypothetical protein [Planctomycetota bacterium]
MNIKNAGHNVETVLLYSLVLHLHHPSVRIQGAGSRRPHHRITARIRNNVTIVKNKKPGPLTTNGWQLMDYLNHLFE